MLRLTLRLLVLCALQEGSSPDVWLQLLLRCLTDPDCKLAVVSKLAHVLTAHKSLTLQQQQELSAQQQQLLAQHQQLSAQQQQLSAQEQLIAAQQRQITGLQEQLSAQQQAASEEMAGLRGQVHELHAAVQQLLSHHQQ